MPIFIENCKHYTKNLKNIICKRQKKAKGGHVATLAKIIAFQTIYQITPCSSIACATFMKPAMFAPLT
jgi:hypothetical protein